MNLLNINNIYKWALNVSQFSYLDRIKIAKFILTNDRWTMGQYVSEFEKKMADFVGCKYAVLVSSGSTANTILAMYLKDIKKNSNKNIIIFPSTTWITSVSPFIREGFQPHFIDINLKDFSLDLNKTNDFLKDNYKNVACIFPTSLIGFVPNIHSLKKIGEKYDCRIMLDNCENTLGTFLNKNVSSFFTSTTSLYFGHQLCAVESGFVFTNDEDEYHYFLMARNHGMVRSLPEEVKSKYENKNVDKRFDFNILGNNFRTSDINAFIGLLDLKRADFYKNNRFKFYNLFYGSLDKSKYYLPIREPELNMGYVDISFCLPIISLDNNKERYNNAKKICDKLGIETRPILSGNLLKHTVFKDHFNCSIFYKEGDFKNSDYLHNLGFYIGLHSKVKESQILELTRELNKI